MTKQARGIRVRSAVAASALGVGCLLAGCSGGTSAPVGTVTTVSGVQHLGTADFASLMAAPGTVLIDVRTPEEFASGHLDGATNIDLRSPDFATQVAALDPTKTYAVYCHSGNRSAQALALMQPAGFSHVADLSGGITAWTGEGRKVVS